MSAVLEVREPSARYLEADEPALVRRFGLLATAPGGVARLRELVVLLALQGKLVEQDLQEESALDWLATIQADRHVRVAKAQGKIPRSLPPVDESDRWFDLPTTWHWVRLNELVTASEAGWSPSCPETPRQGERWGVLKVSAVSWGKFDPDANKELPNELAPRPEHEVRPGDFLLSRANTAELVARSVVVSEAPPHLMLSDKIIRLTFAEGVNRAFINLCNNSSAARSYYATKASGTSSSMKNVSREVVLGLPVPVPPVGEQARIVARVDELMRLCDALEAKGRLEAEQHARLLGTLLGTLTDSRTPEELAANWQRVAAHFDLLLDRPEAVDALEQTILQLAVRGLLVPQDSNDEPANVLLEKVQIEKQALITAGRIRREAPSTHIEGNERPYELPAGWQWVRLRDIWLSSFYGPRFGGEEYVQVGGVPTIRTTDMTDGEIVLKDPPRVQVPADKLDVYRLEPGDLLVTRSGSIGVMALFHLNMVAVPSAYLIRIRFSKNVDVNYCLRFFLGDLGQSQLGLGTTSVGVPNVSASKMADFLFPLPPLSEQTRIVARSDELRRLCAVLRQRLAASQTTQSHLAEALVELAVA